MADPTLMEASFVEAVRRRQRASLRATALVTLALVAAIAALVLYSWLRLEALRADIADESAALAKVTAQLTTAQQQLTASKQQLTASQQQLGASQQALADARKSLAEAQKSVAEASNFVKRLHPLDWRNEKLLMSRNPRAARLIEVLGQEQASNTHFGMQETQSGGFTSPGFANYVLSRATGHAVRYDSLPLREGAPHPGDVVRYDAGYTMFYFVDVPPYATPFVVGMTPIGIASLEVNFGPKIIEVRQTPFSQ